MWDGWRRIRRTWNRTDTLVVSGNALSLALFIGNAWWQSITVAYLGAVIPLTLQCVVASYKPGELRDALIIGGVVASLWPIGEWAVVHTLGWWGAYLEPDFRILETPACTVLVAWLSSTYCIYVGLRVLSAGFGRWTASALTGLSAFMIGALGENLFVWANMWHYAPTHISVKAVPAFIPVSYGLSYAVTPFLRALPSWFAGIALALTELFVSAGLGLAFGFFPR